MSDQLAIVGASVRAAAASAVRAGFQVTAADLFADEDLQSIAAATRVTDYPRELLDWLRTLRPRPAAWMYTGALENHPELVDAMAAVAPLWGNAGDVLREVRSPWLLADALRRTGLRFPETRRSPDGLPRDGSWLAKTGRGASGSGVTVLRDRVADGVVFQQRVAGTPCSAVYVAAGGRAVLLGVVRQLVGEPWLAAREFQYCGAIGPWPVAKAALAEIRRIGDVLAARFGLRGLFGVDFVLDGDHVWTIEVNPRYTASVEIIERATGIHAVGAHGTACSETTLQAIPVQCGRTLHGKTIVFAKRTVTIRAPMTNSLMGASRAARWHILGDVPRPGTRIDAGRPVVTRFADGATADEVQAKLQYGVAKIERQLYAD